MAFKLDVESIAGGPVNMAVKILVVLTIFAAVIGTIFTAIGDINNEFTNNAGALNSTLGTALAPIFPLILVVVVLFGVVRAIIRSVQ